jgi:hypothetical protein
MKNYTQNGKRSGDLHLRQAIQPGTHGVVNEIGTRSDERQAFSLSQSSLIKIYSIVPMRILNSPHRPVEDFENKEEETAGNYQRRETSCNVSCGLSTSAGRPRTRSWERHSAQNQPGIEYEPYPMRTAFRSIHRVKDMEIILARALDTHFSKDKE